MIAPDRIPCINPRCARTSKSDGAGEMICGKCFKALPVEIRRRDKQCRRRLKLIERKIKKALPTSIGEGDLFRFDRIEDAGRKLFYANWDRMRRYYVEPERPAGLENFLRDIGL